MLCKPRYYYRVGLRCYPHTEADTNRKIDRVDMEESLSFFFYSWMRLKCYNIPETLTPYAKFQSKRCYWNDRSVICKSIKTVGQFVFDVWFRGRNSRRWMLVYFCVVDFIIRKFFSFTYFNGFLRFFHQKSHLWGKIYPILERNGKMMSWNLIRKTKAMEDR